MTTEELRELDRRVFAIRDIGRWSTVRLYTTDAISLVLLRELTEAFPDFDISHDDEAPRWTCRAYGEEERDTIYARGDTIGEAICRAWLAWKGVKA